MKSNSPQSKSSDAPTRSDIIASLVAELQDDPLAEDEITVHQFEQASGESRTRSKWILESKVARKEMSVRRARVDGRVVNVYRLIKKP